MSVQYSANDLRFERGGGVVFAENQKELLLIKVRYNYQYIN